MVLYKKQETRERDFQRGREFNIYGDRKKERERERERVREEREGEGERERERERKRREKHLDESKSINSVDSSRFIP